MNLTPAKLGPRDVLRVGAIGLRTRPMRAVLSVLGIAIGIATMVAVVGISASNEANLLSQIDTLGTNMLTVAPGQNLFGGNTKLPERSVEMTGRMTHVRHVGAVGTIDNATIRRNDRISKDDTSGIAVSAATSGLLKTLGTRVEHGRWLNRATGRYPSVVLGSVAAQRLGIVSPGSQVWIGGRWFTVVGILGSAPLAPDIERSAMIGWQAAENYLDFDGHPTTIYERSTNASVHTVESLLPATVNPEHPDEVEVSRPSDALAARAAAKGAFTNLFLGLGAVALLVGGVGVANTMIISVLERRREIGLRRSLGATRGQIRSQFLTESLLLSVLGGVAGSVLGAAGVTIYALERGLPVTLQGWVFAAAIGVTLLVGSLAGLYPAVRAARVSPTVALATT